MKKVLTKVHMLKDASVVTALNVLRLAGAVKDAETLTIGGRTYECDDKITAHVTAGNVRVSVFNGYASSTLNFDDSQNVADGNTVTVGTKVYTFKTTLTNVDGYVKIGPTLNRSIYNMVAAMNVGYPTLIDPPASYGDKNDVGEGAGVAYAAATTVNPANIHTIFEGDYALQVVHWPGGTAGNTVAVAETLVGTGAWIGAGFLDPVPDPTNDQFGTALVAAINGDADSPVWAEKISASEVLITHRLPGAVTLACSETLSTANNVWASATMYGGQMASDGLKSVVCVSRAANAHEDGQERMHFAFSFAPVAAILQVRNASGALVAFDGSLNVVGKRVTITGTGGVGITASDVFNLIVFN